MLQPKKPVKKYVPTAKEKKNLKDATQMKNMRPTAPSSGRVKPTMGGAKNGKTMKKAQGGLNMLLPGGYAPKPRDEKYNTSPSIKAKPKAKAKPKSPIQEATPEEIKKYGMRGSYEAKSGKSMKKCKGGC